MKRLGGLGVIALVSACSGAPFTSLEIAGGDASIEAATDARPAPRSPAGPDGAAGSSDASNGRPTVCVPSSPASPRPVAPLGPAPKTVGVSDMHDMSALCDPDLESGARGPIAVCNTAAPCSSSSGTITTDTTQPSCMNGDVLVSWLDSVVDDSNVGSGGVPSPDRRYACAPAAAPSVNATPVPLVVYFTPSFTSADTIYSATGLRASADTWNWTYPTAGAKAVGFVLVIQQARNLQLGALGPGLHEDNMYHPADPSSNPDIRNADALIDWAIARYGPRVDRARIYVTGWSNGAMFGQLYAIARHPSTHWPGRPAWGAPTPGGNYVAAAAVYSGDDPFVALPSGDCATRTYPGTSVPVYLSHRQCDLVPCEETQQRCFFGYASRLYGSTGASTSLSVEFWLTSELAATTGPHAMRDSSAVDVVLDGWGNHLAPGVASCQPSAGGTNASGGSCNAFPTWIPTPSDDPTPGAVSSVPATSSGCSPTAQLINHVLWPKNDEGNLLAFLAGHAAGPACASSGM